MGFLFFKTAKEKEREARREKRHALRKAEGAVDEVTERIKKMETDAEAEWDRARDGPPHVARQPGERAPRAKVQPRTASKTHHPASAGRIWDTSSLDNRPR